MTTEGPGLVAQLKERWSLLEVLDLVGLAEGRKGLKFLCPSHADVNPSAHLYVDQDRWQCFVCDAGGDQLDLFAASQGLSLADAIAALATEAGIDFRQSWGTTKRRPSPAQDVFAIEGKAQLEVLRSLERDFPQARGREAWCSLVEAAYYHHDEIMRRYRNRELKPETVVELLLTWWKWMTGGRPHKQELLTLFSVIGDDRFWRAIVGELRPPSPDPGTHPGGPPGTPPSQLPTRRRRPSLMGGS
jgi:hypothetical protein